MGKWTPILPGFLTGSDDEEVEFDTDGARQILRRASGVAVAAAIVGGGVAAYKYVNDRFGSAKTNLPAIGGN